MIVFSGLPFILRFLPVFLLAYYVVPKRFQNTVLFIGSLVFYAFGQVRFLPLLCGLTIINYGFALWIARMRRLHCQKSYIMPCFLLILIVDVAVLLVFKALALGVSADWLPLGISFYIFKMLSFQADCYMGKVKGSLSFFAVAAYFTMFPQVTQGPIMRYDGSMFAGGRRFSLMKLEQGIEYFVIGFGMKVLLADRLGILWNEIGKIGFESISTPLAWLGVYGYSLELYFDFWGYSLMAAGLGMMLGFPYIENFAHPYLSKSISEYYRRWHITLGAWFRDYVYIPLGGSRGGVGRTIRNLLIVWLITGLWHGGTLNFLLWGGILGIIIVLEKYPLKRAMQKTSIIGRLLVWIAIPLTWGIFAITDLGDLGVYFSRLFPFAAASAKTAAAGGLFAADFVRYGRQYWLLFAAGILLWVPQVFDFLRVGKKGVLEVFRILLLFGIFLGALYVVSLTSGNPFMYYNF